MKRHIWIEIISYAFILLFMYTAISKLSDYKTNLYDLGRSPFIGEFALPLSVLIPLSEIAISVMLFVPKWRTYGMYGTAFLMILFTGYVSAMVFTLKELPCSCGGIIRDLSWKQHFFFNVFFTLVAFIGVFLQRRQVNNLKFDQSS